MQYILLLLCAWSVHVLALDFSEEKERRVATMGSPELTGKLCFIFDFDGTIADSWPLIFDALNRYSHLHGGVSIACVDDIRNKNMQEILQECAVADEQLPLIIEFVRAELKTHIASLQPFPGIVEVLHQLTQMGISLGILTTNSQHAVEKFLALHTITGINFVEGGSGLFAKKELLHTMLKTHNLDPAHVVYVGDETRDIEAANANHIRSVAVTWGFNTAEKLETQHPTCLISSPNELLAIAKRYAKLE